MQVDRVHFHDCRRPHVMRRLVHLHRSSPDCRFNARRRSAGRLVHTGYALAKTATLLLIERVTDIFGRVKLYSAGFVVFTIGSLPTDLSE